MKLYLNSGEKILATVVPYDKTTKLLLVVCEQQRSDSSESQSTILLMVFRSQEIWDVVIFHMTFIVKE